jgi:hypothetical protein
MANEDYRSFQGRVYAGPFSREVTTQSGQKTVIEYMFSGPGVNSDIEIKGSFWNGDPGIGTGDLVFISGKFSTYDGKDKNGDQKTTKTINVNYGYKIAGEELKVADRGPQAAPKKQRPAPGTEPEIDF